VYARARLDWLTNIQHHERKVFAQQGEDGVLEYLFDHLGATNRYYVEFGIETGTECNTRLLHEDYAFNGLLIDWGHTETSTPIKRQVVDSRIDAENIVPIFAADDARTNRPVPKEFDLLSVDIDYNDWYVLRSILQAGYRPRIVVTEFNRNFAPTDSFSVKYDGNKGWQRDAYFGMTGMAAARIMDAFGYQVVYVDANSVNVFFVRHDVLLEYVNHGWKGFDVGGSLFDYAARHSATPAAPNVWAGPAPAGRVQAQTVRPLAEDWECAALPVALSWEDIAPLLPSWIDIARRAPSLHVPESPLNEAFRAKMGQPDKWYEITLEEARKTKG